MSRHTEGPWNIKKKQKYYAVMSKDVPLALVLPNYIKNKSAVEANASLIATAPQLLKALKKVLEHLSGGGPHCLDSLMDGISSDSFGFFLVKHQAASANG